MTCGWIGLCRLVLRRVPFSHYRNLLSTNCYDEFCRKRTLFAISCQFLDNPPMCMENLPRKGPFDYIRHDLLIAELHAYGISHEALTLINDYLTNRQQRVKVNGSFSSWKDLTRGVPHYNELLQSQLVFIIFKDVLN